MTHACVTMVVPFAAEKEGKVNALLDQLGDVTRSFRSNEPKPTGLLGNAQLHGLGEFVHFMSMIVVPAERGPHAFLLIEVCADGQLGAVIDRLVQTIPDALRAVIRQVDSDAPETDQQIRAYFESKKRRIEVGRGWFVGTPGLLFSGTPGMTVSRIREEAKLATKIRELVDKDSSAGPARAKLELVRREVFGDASLKWAFVSEPVPLLGDTQPKLDQGKSLFAAAWRDFLWPIVPIPVLVGLVSFCRGSNALEAILHGFLFMLFELLVIVVALAVGYGMLRRQEEDDVPVDVEPRLKHIKQVMEREDQPGIAQNHLGGVSILKPGVVRRASLHFALWVIAEVARGRSRPGFIDKISTIHFARWLLLPGTNRLVFLSNYDGSWQSYLEDFIARLRSGLTSVWSNTRDFPKTNNLFGGGAGDGARFKRWARRQQIATRFWFSAYPQLTTNHIRANAAIRHGFASASSEAEAAKWLALFGYAAPENVEKEEICALALGGLPFFRYSRCFILHFTDEDLAREWLRGIESKLGYGEHTEMLDEIQVVAFTASGLLKLGRDQAALATFPSAFQQGMAAPERLRALGDETTNEWSWGQQGSVDAVLILYAKNADVLAPQLTDAVRRLDGAKHKRLKEVSLQEIPERNEQGERELYDPFGFREGISQPIMRGSKHWSRPENDLHVVEPGELVLGYRDNLGNISPTPSMRGKDIGRNGSFLVIRQLEQDVHEFDDYVFKEAKRLKNDKRVPGFQGADLEHWVAARMMGRWRDGSSLVRYSHPPPAKPKPGEEPRRPDNDFRFGREDEDGLRCPLGAHIRRANPRDSFEPGSEVQLAISNRHRILRVGRIYKPDKGKDPGLLFMCVNADIERQFEFLQQSWLLGAGFHGLDNEIDPIVGFRNKDDSMTVPTPRGPVRMRSLAKFVHMRGGGYFFLPGRSAISILLGR